MKLKTLSILVALIFVSCNKNPNKKVVIKEVSLGPAEQLNVPEYLSEWNFFTGEIKNLDPADGIIPYDLNTPLFTDYAHKLRFVKLPDGELARYNDLEVIDFPLGTILIKNFYYPTNFEAGRNIIETRLLIHEKVGWNAFTYVWNEDQTDAKLEISGVSVPVSWTNHNGKLVSIDYSVPNLVQCKSCHELNGRMTPIGPTARQLNRPFDYKNEKLNQLKKWEELGILSNLPELDLVPKLAVWDDPESGNLDSRARAWLEINCAHCHRREGPAKNSGLYLRAIEEDKFRLGINKPPVAAGRGSAGLQYAIVPGNPDKSILYHRINSLDPGVMMPELGRKTIHAEGVSLIAEWIKELQPK